MCGDDKSFYDIKISGKPIYIELHCSTMPELTVIFIPFNHEVVYWTGIDNEKVFHEELMGNYLKDPRNIIVLLIEKDYEINCNRLCFRRGSSHFDLKRTRTLGVITGLDTATTPEQFRNI